MYKKIIFIIIMFLLILSCQSIDPKYKWYDGKTLIKKEKQLESGDILILSKKNTLLSMWGHIAILNEDKKIVEFPSYGKGYSESPLFFWYKLDRKIAVFRLKNIDDEFKKILFEEIDKTLNKKYGITFDKDFDKRLYCSQFIYLIFKRAGLKVNKNINLDSNGGRFVMPFDVMNSEFLENVELK